MAGLPIATISSNAANQKTLQPFQIKIVVLPSEMICKRASAVGYSVENTVTNQVVSGFPLITANINTASWFEGTYTVNPGGWGIGKYRIRAYAIDACGNRSTSDQTNFINVEVPDFVELKVLAPKNGEDVSQADNTIKIQVAYDAQASAALIENKKSDKISFYSPTLNNSLLNCSTLIPKSTAEISFSAKSPTRNCTYKVNPFQATYDFTMKSAAWPEGIHLIEINMIDTNGIEYTTTTNILVPKMTTTEIVECPQSNCQKNFSGKASFTVLPRIDTRTQITIKEVGIRVDGQNLAGTDSQGNLIAKANFANYSRADTGSETAWKVTEKLNRFPIILDTSSWDNGLYKVSVYTIDSRDIKSTYSTTISVNNIGPIVESSSIQAPRGDVKEQLRLSINASPPPESSAKIKSVQVLVNGTPTIDGLKPEFRFNEVKNKAWEVTDSTRFSWVMELAPPKGILEKRQVGYFPLSADRQTSTGSYSDNFQFIITDTYGRQTQTAVYQSEITCNPCRKLVVRDSSISAQGGDVSKAQLISFDVDIPSQAISTISRVRVLRDGKPVTEGLEPQFDNSGIRGDGWAVDKGSKFTWKLKFGSSDQIIDDDQKGFWNVPIADDPAKDPRILSTLSFEVVDNFGRVTASSVKPDFVITCLFCESEIIEKLKNRREVVKQRNLASNDRDKALSSFENLGGIKQKLDSLYSSAVKTNREVQNTHKDFNNTRTQKIPFGKKTIIIKYSTTTYRNYCSNASLIDQIEETKSRASTAVNTSDAKLKEVNNARASADSLLSDIDSIKGSVRNAYEEILKILNQKGDISEKEVARAKILRSSISDYLKKLEDNKRALESIFGPAAAAEKDVDQISTITPLNKIFVNTFTRCTVKDGKVNTPSSKTVDGSKAGTKTKGPKTTITCRTPDGIEKDVEGFNPVCPKGTTKV